MRLMLVHTHTRWPCPSSSMWFTEMEQLESYLPLVQVNCLQHHHAGALQHQLHDHILHRELVPQSGNMKNHMIKYKGNPIRFTVIRLFTNHGYNNHLLVGYHQHAHPHHGLPLDKPELRQVHHLHHQLAEHERGAEIKLAHDHHLLRQGVLRPVDPSVVLLFNIQQAFQLLCPHHAVIVVHLHCREAHNPESHCLHEVPGTPPLKASFHL